ncbi:MAG: hypothetical protein SNH94_01260 [Rikenellaceae bacterium]
MKKLLFLSAALVMAATSCSKFEDDANTMEPSTDGTRVSIAVAASNAEDVTRVAVDGETWAVTWAEDDDLLLYGTNTNYGSATKLTISESGYGAEVSTFITGQDSWGYDLYVQAGEYRLIHPYLTNAPSYSATEEYTMDLSSQKDNLAHTFMVSNGFVNIDATGSSKEVETPSMVHIGAAIDLNVKMAGDTDGVYVINSVKICDVPTAVTIDITKMITEDGFYVSETIGDIAVSFSEEAAIDESEISNYKINILPFERKAGEELTLKFFGTQKSTGDSFYIIKTFNLASDTSFARGTYNTINAALSVEDATEMGAAIEVVEMSAGSLMITADVVINKDVCDGYIYSCSETSGNPVKLSESNYYGYICQTSGIQPMRAALLGYNTEYLVSIVGYKIVDGAITPVGEEFTYTLTTSGLEYGKSEDTVLATYSDVTYTSISATYERGDAVASFYGCVATSELVAYDDVAAYIEGSDWYSLPANYAHVFYSSSYTSTLTYNICSGLTTYFDTLTATYSSLEKGTEYTMFTIPIGSNGLIGTIETQTVSTKALVIDDNIVPTVVYTPASTSASFDFELGDADYVLYRHVSSSQAGYTEAEDVYDSFIEGDSNYYVTKLSAADQVTITGLSIGTTNYMYYIGVMEDGTVGEMKSIEYGTVIPTFDANASVEYSIASETISNDWYTTSTVVYDITMKDDATSYILYTLSKYSTTNVDTNDAGAFATYVLGLSYGNTPVSTETATTTYTVSDYYDQYSIIIPITDENTYGTPIVFEYNWAADTFDSDATVDISLASSSVSTSTYQGTTESIATITMNVTLDNGAVSYICGVISGVDTGDSDAVGTAVVSLAGYSRQDSSDEETQEFSITKDTDSYFAIVPVDAEGAYGTPVVYEFDGWDGTGGGSDPLPSADITLEVSYSTEPGETVTVVLDVTTASTVTSYYYAIIDSYVSADDAETLEALCLAGTESTSDEIDVKFTYEQYLAVLPVTATGTIPSSIAICDIYEIAGTGTAPAVAPSLTLEVELESAGVGGTYYNAIYSITLGSNTAGYLYGVIDASSISSTDSSAIQSYLMKNWNYSSAIDMSEYVSDGQYVAFLPIDNGATALGAIVISDPWNTASSSGSTDDSTSLDFSSSATATLSINKQYSGTDPNFILNVELSEGAESYIYYHHYDYQSSGISDRTDTAAVGAKIVSSGTSSTASTVSLLFYEVDKDFEFFGVVPVDGAGNYGTPVIFTYDDLDF